MSSTRAVGDRSGTERIGGETGTAEVVVDARGFVTHWNACAEQLIGFSADEVVGRPAADLLAEPVPREELRRTLAEHCERWSGPLVLRHRDGARVDVVVIAHHVSG